MSKEELIDKAKEANNAIKNNDITLQDDLKKEIQNW